MEIKAIINEQTSLVGVTITHGDETLIFNMATRRSSVSADTMFAPCNSLISNLSPDAEETLFSAYVRAKELLTAKCSLDETLEELRGIHSTIFSCISPVGAEAWATGSYMGFAIPPAISARKEGNYPAHSSYDQLDYCGLCGLSTLLKFHVPIVFLFLDPIGALVGKDMREYVLFSQLDEDDLLLTAAYTKLKNYTIGAASTNGSVKIPTGLVLEGICTDDEFAKLILAPKLLRDLALSETDIPYIGDVVNNIIAKITKAINTQLMTLRKSHDYTTKRQPGDGVEGLDGNLSGHEDTQVYESYSSLYSIVYNRATLAPNLHHQYGVEDDVYNEFMGCVNKASGSIGLNSMKLSILAMALPRIPPEAFTLIRPNSKGGIYRLVAIAAGVLHQKGLHELVSILMSKSTELGTLTAASHYVALESKFDQDLLAEVKKNYDEQVGGHCLVTREIERLVKEVVAYGWVQQTPAVLHPSYGIDKIFNPSKDFKNQILTLLK